MNILYGYQVASQVIELIQTTRPGEPLVLASAYFRPWGALDNALQNALVADKIPITIIVRSGDVLAKNIKATRPYAELGAHVGFVERLHAKFFINEQTAIIGSLNLVESSAVDSWEMAVRLGAVTDNVAFMELWRGYAALRKLAEQEMARNGLGMLDGATAPTAANTKKLEVKAKAPTAKKPAKAKAKNLSAKTKTKAKKLAAKAKAKAKAAAQSLSPAGAGHCIRCDTSIPLKVDKPHCRACWSAWSKYSNKDYEEKHCHACGKKHGSTQAKPLCKPCWRKLAS